MFTFTIQPDLQTREAVMVAAGRVQLSLTDTDGNVRYIKIEAKAKDMPGSSKRYTAVPLAQATHVFISEKGYGTTRLGTYYPPKPGYTDGRMYEDLPQGNGHIVALKAAVNYINGLGLDHPFVSIDAESQCGLCGHKLEDPISVQRGIGPDCAQKPTGSKILHASAFAGEQLAMEAHAEAYADDADDQPVATPTVTLSTEQAMTVLGMFSVTVGETDGTAAEWALAAHIQQALGMEITPMPEYVA